LILCLAEEPEQDIDPRCYRANGFFNHEAKNECNKFYNCVNGVAYELPCATTLIFDEAQGTCVREEQASSYAKICEKSLEKRERYIIKARMNVNRIPPIYFLAAIDGFSCPDTETIGPHGQPLAHPSFPHPSSCQKFITCYFGKDIRELGCMKGQVFDHLSLKCSTPEDGPEDWYVSLSEEFPPTYATFLLQPMLVRMSRELPMSHFMQKRLLVPG
jgi:hypothetical protein